MLLNRKKAVWIYILFLAVTVVSSYGYFAGITGRTKKGGFTEGCKCHGPAPFNNVSVSISGPDTVSPGQTVNYMLSIAGGPLVKGGTNIAVSLGELNVLSGSGLRKQDGELTHQQPKSPESGTVSFLFSYTAPQTEAVDTIFANGNSVSGDTLPENDNWNFANNKVITVKNPIGIISYSGEIPVGYRLEQNYPNPFNPVTSIRFSIPQSSLISLKLYDLEGKEMMVLLNSNLSHGSYTYELNASNLASGVYFYSISAGKFKNTKKLVIIK